MGTGQAPTGGGGGIGVWILVVLLVVLRLGMATTGFGFTLMRGMPFLRQERFCRSSIFVAACCLPPMPPSAAGQPRFGRGFSLGGNWGNKGHRLSFRQRQKEYTAVDLELLQEQLAQTERLVAEAEMQVVRQMQIVGELAGSGEQAVRARDLLMRFQENLEMHSAERDALRRQLRMEETRC